MNIKLLVVCIFLSISFLGHSQEVKYIRKTNIPYCNDSINNSDSLIAKSCLLDVYYPESKKDFATVVWIHGGGLTTGKKYLPKGLMGKDICVVSVEYRLSPFVKCPKYIEDCATAVAWVFNNIESYGGDSTLIFVSGHSAGGYLADMIGMDKKWLKAYGINANRIAGLIPLSGHTITHAKIREENGINYTQPIVDEFAPLFYVRPDAPPLLLITGDRELEMWGRYEENAYMMRMMKVAGHQDTKLYELGGYGHDTEEAAFPILLKEVNRIVETKKKKEKN